MEAIFLFHLETVHEVALKDKEPDTQDAEEVKVRWGSVEWPFGRAGAAVLTVSLGAWL